MEIFVLANKKFIWNVGDMIGYWKYLGESEREIGKPRRIHCQCTICGNEYDILVCNLSRAKNFMCKSCNNRITWTTHGLSNSPLYAVLKDMHARCENPNHHKYENYGGRGITVCSEWGDNVDGIKTFVAWSELNGYKDGLQIDRFDNDKGYCPENCRWVTPSINNFNRRNTKGYKKYGNSWVAYITVNSKMINLGSFSNEDEAIEARKQAELFYYGENSPAYRDH